MSTRPAPPEPKRSGDRLASKGAITGQRFPAATRAGFDAVIGKISRPKS